MLFGLTRPLFRISKRRTIRCDVWWWGGRMELRIVGGSWLFGELTHARSTASSGAVSPRFFGAANVHRKLTFYQRLMHPCQSEPIAISNSISTSSPTFEATHLRKIAVPVPRKHQPPPLESLTTLNHQLTSHRHGALVHPDSKPTVRSLSTPRLHPTDPHH